MKKYYYILTFGLASLFAGCDLDINENPDVSTGTTIEEVMPVVLFYGAQLNYDHAEYGTFLSQALTTGGRSETNSLAYKGGWEFLLMNRHPQWRRHFYDIGTNAKELITMAQEAGVRNYELIGESVVLMSTLYTTDAFGPMPRSQALTPGIVAPKYDSQEEIYEYMFSKVDELIKKYEDPAYTEAPGNRPITIKQDRIFAGDLDKWKRFTYALKARIYLRKLPNWDPSAENCKIIIDAVDAALKGGGWEDPLYRYDGGVNEKNCPWGPAQPTINTWESRANQLDQAIISKYFAEDIMNVNALSRAARDPRATKIMKRRSGPAGDATVKYRYLENNFGMEAAYLAKHFPDLYFNEDDEPGIYTSNTGYVPYILEEELLLIKAEAQYWSGDKDGAYITTKEAARINMERHGVDSETIETYLGRPQFFPANGFDIGHIMRQKYVCMYLQPEQWTDMRRYKYSNNKNNELYDGVIVYPGLRRPYNLYKGYWYEDENHWVQRLNYDPETEDKYNRAELDRLGAYKNYKWLRVPMIWAQ